MSEYRVEHSRHMSLMYNNWFGTLYINKPLNKMIIGVVDEIKNNSRKLVSRINVKQNG